MAKPLVYIYCDGACFGNPGPGGWAALLAIPRSSITKAFSGGCDKTTNNPMELTAAAEINIFDKQHPSIVTKFVSQLKMPVFATIGNALMQPCNFPIQFVSIVRAFLLMFQSALQQCQLAVQ